MGDRNADRQMYRRRRLAALAVATGLVLAVILVWQLASSKHRSRPGATQPPGTSASTTITAADAGWSLAAPLSRAVALSDGRSVTIMGGLDSRQASLTSVSRLDPTNGKANPSGSLAVAAHDAAGASIDGRLFVFGGGEQQTSDVVQAQPPGGQAAVVAHLPQPRSDFAAVTVGPTTYLVGGYDGKTPTPAVLSTTDGTQFKVVTELPLGVRYPAVVAKNNHLFVFGGEMNGTEQSAVQDIDLQNGTARIAAQLPTPRTQAMAFVLGDSIYVVGGKSGGAATDSMLRFDATKASFSAAGALPVPVADSAVAVVGNAVYVIGGEAGTSNAPVATVAVVRPEAPSLAKQRAGPPFTGRLLIADRGNDRLLTVDVDKHILWTYPSPTAPAPAGGFYFPDDAFFAENARSIITNQEENNTIIKIAYPSGAVEWTYGRPKVAGSAPGLLNQPDDAYLLPDKRIVVADAKNCRILFISPQGDPISQIGTTGKCVHNPPTGVGYPNGDTPLPNGDILVSEINGSWVTEYTQDGKLVWTVHLPIAYPSDPQQIGPDLYLLADYTTPGGILEFTREGQIVWSYRPTSGPDMLNKPSLAERLPNGLIGVNDDYRHRVAIIDPNTKTIVWQYGVTDQPGTGPGSLNTPDGFDLQLANGMTPQHTGAG